MQTRKLSPTTSHHKGVDGRPRPIEVELSIICCFLFLLTKNTQEWQNTFKHWKRHEARAQKMYIAGAVGGPASGIQMSDVKKRTLNALSRVAVDGNNISEVCEGAPTMSFFDTVSACVVGFLHASSPTSSLPRRNMHLCLQLRHRTGTDNCQSSRGWRIRWAIWPWTPKSSYLRVWRRNMLEIRWSCALVVYISEVPCN